MKRAFVDTNLFIRYLTNDDPEKANRVARLLSEAESGKRLLVTSDLVITEIVWVLESGYGLGRAEIAPLIRGILATPGLEVRGGDLVARAVGIYATHNVDFVDAHAAAVMEKEGIEEVYSYDKKHPSRIAGISRREP